jgi:large subunit ribosomal protein L31
MKEGIHPELKEATIKCASCGNIILTRSTKGSYNIDVCNACHPVFTGSGNRLMIDTEGRIERFRRKYRTAAKA